MTWLMIGGPVFLGVVVFLLVAAVALLVYLSQSGKASEKRLRENGTPVLAVVVMSNAEFSRDVTIAAAPALVLISFEPPSDLLVADMLEVATELFGFYLAPEQQIKSLPNYQQQMAKRVKNDTHQKGRRTRVAREMSLGHVLYMADLWMERKNLPNHVPLTKILACLATGRDEGEIMLLPPAEKEAQDIYDAVGAEEALREWVANHPSTKATHE